MDIEWHCTIAIQLNLTEVVISRSEHSTAGEMEIKGGLRTREIWRTANRGPTKLAQMRSRSNFFRRFLHVVVVEAANLSIPVRV